MKLNHAPALHFLATFVPLVRTALADADAPQLQPEADMRTQLDTFDTMEIALRVNSRDQGPLSTDFRFAQVELSGMSLVRQNLKITLVQDNLSHDVACVLSQELRIPTQADMIESAARELATVVSQWLLQGVVPDVDRLKDKIRSLWVDALVTAP